MEFHNKYLRVISMFFFVIISVGLVQCNKVKNVAFMQRDRPDYFNWNDKGVITPVRNQGKLGDAVDFALAEEVESLYAIQYRTSAIKFSVEEVAECCDDSRRQPKFKGFDCIVNIGGLCRESTYRIGTGACNNGTCKAIGKVTQTGYIQRNREDIMLDKILITPLLAYINAGVPSFEMYQSGIYSDPDCVSSSLDHAVQVIGYGSHEGQDYWIIKNSWGESWGQNGYMTIARGKNMCGIAELVFYPINIE